MKPPTSTTKAAYIEKGKIADSFEKFVLDAANEAKKQWKKRYPQHAEQVGVVITAKGIVRGPKGMFRVIEKIAQRLMQPEYLSKTNVAILKAIASDFPDLTLHTSIFQKELPAWQLTKIKRQVNNGMAKPPNLDKIKTLAHLKERLKAQSLILSGGARSAAAKITVSSNDVVIGKEAFPIIERKSGKHTYRSIQVTVGGKRQWLREDVLCALFNI